MKKTIVAFASAIALSGCVAETEDELSPRDEVVEEIVDNLVLAGYPEQEIAVDEDGVVIVGGDAVVSLEASREMIGVDDLHDDHDDHEGESFRQYRTTNLVSSSVNVICIDGRMLSGTLSNGLDNAIDNYNDLPLSFTMQRIGANSSGCDAVITAAAKGPAGGQSGFPSGGMPYGSFQVGKGTASYGLAVATHVITHELGHCVGLRHTDYFDRSISCGTGGNEGSSGVGAIHISGTPTGATLDGSVMNSCFNTGSTGVFTGGDVTALNNLY